MADNSSSDLHGHRGKLISFIDRQLQNRSDAEDVVQESILRTELAQRAGPIGNVRAYLYRIANNLAVDVLRHRAVRDRHGRASSQDPEAQAVASPEPSAEQILLDRERMRLFEAALSDLPARQRRALALHRLEGWSYPRIADHLGCSPNTVYNDVKAAMQHVIARTAEMDL